MIKWLADRFDGARAKNQAGGRGERANEPPANARQLGKKQQKQEAAKLFEGLFAPPPAPKLAVNNN